MNKRLVGLLFILASIPVTLAVLYAGIKFYRSRAAVGPGTLVVSGTSLNLNGSRFIVEGTNMEFYRDPGCDLVTTGAIPLKAQIAQKMKDTGINAVRLNYSHSWLDDNPTNLNNFLDMIQALADKGIFSMPSDHDFTGKPLTNRATAYPMFQSIIQGARARGIEGYLIMNPYNEPGGADSQEISWADWVTAQKDTLNFIRNTAGFQGIVVLDTRSWAADFDVNSMQQVLTYDQGIATGGAKKVVFSNHWYPNIPLSNPQNAANNSNVVPVLTGELGQYNATPLDPQYVKNVLKNVVDVGIPKGHNGVFAWIWTWCDDNNMTSGWDNQANRYDYFNLSTYGQIYVTEFYNKVNGGGAGTPGPTNTGVATATSVATATATATGGNGGGGYLLHMQGTSLVNAQNQRFVIEGANIELFRDYGGCPEVTDGQYPLRTQIATKMKSMGINVVRVNYSQQYLNNTTNYNKFIDFMKVLTQNGIMVMPSDHSLTGNSLSTRSSYYATMKKIVDSAKSGGFEQYLIMNPFNEPGPDDSWAQWVTAQKDILNYLRNTANFKGVVVLDTLSWAAAYDDTAMAQVVAHDDTLLPTSNIIFSNHWYPNININSPKSAADNANNIPILIGELGQINPGSSGLDLQYAKNVLSYVVNPGISKGHNGVFAWIWNWCDENTMTNGDFQTLNSYGQTYVNSYYNLVGNGALPTPTATATSNATATSQATATATSNATNIGQSTCESGINYDQGYRCYSGITSSTQCQAVLGRYSGYGLGCSTGTFCCGNIIPGQSTPTATATSTGTGGQCTLKADINKDNKVDLLDYVVLFEEYHNTCP